MAVRQVLRTLRLRLATLTRTQPVPDLAEHRLLRQQITDLEGTLAVLAEKAVPRPLAQALAAEPGQPRAVAVDVSAHQVQIVVQPLGRDDPERQVAVWADVLAAVAETELTGEQLRSMDSAVLAVQTGAAIILNTGHSRAVARAAIRMLRHGAFLPAPAAALARLVRRRPRQAAAAAGVVAAAALAVGVALASAHQPVPAGRPAVVAVAPAPPPVVTPSEPTPTPATRSPRPSKEPLRADDVAERPEGDRPGPGGGSSGGGGAAPGGRGGGGGSGGQPGGGGQAPPSPGPSGPTGDPAPPTQQQPTQGPSDQPTQQPTQPPAGRDCDLLDVDVRVPPVVGIEVCL
ncbi:hypothetical protein [Planotetraspora sp. GP83]|uniref:hypothetical protein n=1 Tax=Planotetraspora sp. GP83 TaxID=3156264 RepID=UPI0035185CAE